MAFLEILLFFFMSFEVYYFLRFFIVATYLKVMKWKGLINKSPFEEGIVYGVCTTTDLDFMCHMSNSRYLRELDFGRVIFVVRNGMFTTLKNIGADMALAATTIRYRRSVTLFQVFRIRTKVVSWDDRNLYMEQRMETIHDNFTRAIAYVKVVLVGNVSVNDMLKELDHAPTVSPVPPPELARWIEFNDLSSKSLQKERGCNASECSNGDAHSTKVDEGNICIAEAKSEVKRD